jgi:cytochrome c5
MLDKHISGKIIYFGLSLCKWVRQAGTVKGNIVTDIEDRNFMSMLYMVIGTLTAFFVLCIVVARIVSADDGAATSDPMVEAATIERIKPFGEVNVGKAPVVVASSGVNGKATYGSACLACHATGAAGAPKMGDKAAWKNRIAQGMGVLDDHAINGFKAMPAKGGNASLSDAEVKAAVKYMVKNSK